VDTKKQIEKMREFNRFYTNIIGLLDRYLLNSSYTLPEVRVMFEINANNKISANQISEILDMDKGYLSRMLVKFEKQGLIKRVSSKEDGRIQYIVLTEKGKKVYLEIDGLSTKQVSKILTQLSPKERKDLVNHFDQIKSILNKIQE